MWSTFFFTVGPTRSLSSLVISPLSLSLCLSPHPMNRSPSSFSHCAASAPLSPTHRRRPSLPPDLAAGQRRCGAEAVSAVCPRRTTRRRSAAARELGRWRGRPCGARWWRGRSGEVRRRLRLEKRRGRRRQAPSGASSSRHHHGRWAGLPPRRPLLANSIVLPPHLAGVLGPSDGDDWWHGLGGGGGGRRGPVWRDDHLGAR